MGANVATTVCAVDYGAGSDKGVLLGHENRPLVRRSLSTPARDFEVNFGTPEKKTTKVGICSAPGERPAQVFDIGDTVYTRRDKTADFQVDSGRYMGERALIHILSMIVELHRQQRGTGESIRTVLGLGLNAEDYKTKADIVRRDFTGTFHVMVDDVYYDIEIQTVIVVPQPWAAYVHVIGNNPKMAKQRTMILDWGRMTLDTIFVEDGDVDLDSFFALNVGVQTVVRRIQAAISKTYKVNLPPLEADRLLDPKVAQSYPIGGASRDLRRLVHMCRQTHWNDTLRLLQSRLQGTEVHNLVFVGGGAYVFRPQIDAWMKDGIPVVVPGSPHLAVVHGMLEEAKKANTPQSGVHEEPLERTAV